MTEKNDKLDFIKTKMFALQNTVKKMKRQITDWDKIFAKHV